MKKKLLLLLYTSLLYTFLHPTVASVQAQCSGIQVSYTTTESRCMSTGTISVAVTGGSGNYNYKAEGPLVTSFTSSGTITGLKPGTYKIIVKDVARGCQVETAGVVVQGSYQDPRFGLTHTNVSCAGNDGTISLSGLQYGRAPFTYSIIAPSPAGVGTTNNTGSFSGLVPGEYAIQLKDSCGGIQVRRITIENYTWSIDAAPATRVDCNKIDVQVKVKDNKGNANPGTGAAAFAGFQYGIVNSPGDTTWYSTYNFQHTIGNKRSATFVAKDPCGKVQVKTWTEPVADKPSVGNVTASNWQCNTFTATISGQQKLTTPQYFLFDNNNNLVGSNTTGQFTGLPYGSYCMNIKDACYDTTIVKCFTEVQPARQLNAPVITNTNCTTFTAAITPANFTASQYCISDGNGNLLACNTTGIFEDLPYGNYCIQVTDACSGSMITRCLEELKPVPVINQHTITGGNCTDFDVAVQGTNLSGAQYCLYDSVGNVVACNYTGIFEDVAHGSYCIKAIVCGVTSNAACFNTGAAVPAIDAAVKITNRLCATFDVAATGQTNLTTPLFELINTNTNEVIASNNTGIFTGVPYGSYCVKLTDGCNGTIINRCFTEAQRVPTLDATMQMSNTTCGTFTATVKGDNLFSPQYNLYNAANELIGTNTTGVFDNLPYGSYCAEVIDGCTNTTMRVCQTFAMEYNMSLTTSKTCAIGTGAVTVSFTNGFAPYAINIYKPDGTLQQTASTNNSSITFTLPALADGLTYSITATDNCGRADTEAIAPDHTVVTKSVTVVAKCPSAAAQNGSGNLIVSSTSNYKTKVTPRLIRRGTTSISRGASSVSGNIYTFSDLEAATYVIEYTIETCTNKIYDTVTIAPYTYPSQGQSAVYQCDNNSISLNAQVAGGLGPYRYQIIGSDPESPSIITAEQSTPQFNINTGMIYSLVRLRTIDACGNATLNDISVLPLQNVLIKASNDCFFQNVVLSVDTIENAQYQWFKKTGANDSVLLTTDLTYNMPFMYPEDVGTYVCKITVDAGCITRVASYTLDGDCGHEFLPGTLQLKGTKAAGGNTLNWNTADITTTAYTVERKTPQEAQYVAIAQIKATPANGQQPYTYTDANSTKGTYQYRIKGITGTGKTTYSNSITLTGNSAAPLVYPNPIINEVNIAFSGKQAATYRIQLHNSTGQAVYQTELKNITTSNFRYQRNPQLGTGFYVLKITNTTTGETVHHKLLFK